MTILMMLLMQKRNAVPHVMFLFYLLLLRFYILCPSSALFASYLTMTLNRSFYLICPSSFSLMCIEVFHSYLSFKEHFIFSCLLFLSPLSPKFSCWCFRRYCSRSFSHSSNRLKKGNLGGFLDLTFIRITPCARWGILY